MRDLVARAEAVTAVRDGEDFLAVSAAFKRMKNILAQADFELAAGDAFSGEVSGASPEQKALAIKAMDVAKRVADFGERRGYVSALEAVATLRPEVDAFFSAVMVMDADLEVRQQRLVLLATIIKNFSRIADFSEIVVAG